MIETRATRSDHARPAAKSNWPAAAQMALPTSAAITVRDMIPNAQLGSIRTTACFNRAMR
jgi:hypothetical protein